MRIVFQGATHIGMRRHVNEDAFLVDEDWRLAAVADGAGAGAPGDCAGHEVLRALRASLEGARAQLAAAPPRVLGMMLRRAVEHANASLHQRGIADPIWRGTVATLVAAIFSEDRAYIAHVGDSRALLLRDGELTALTEDHTLVNEMIRCGQLAPGEAAGHNLSGVITRAVGSMPAVDVDLTELDLVPGDRVLLATDGLWRLVAEADLAELMARPPEDAVAAAIDRANAAGGLDNIALVLAAAEPE